MARWLGAALGFGMVAALAACAAPPPPPPPPTVVVLTLTATKDANPSPDGQGAPVALRVYQLAGTANFTAAEFFDLFSHDQTALKTDLVKRDDLTLAPGQSRTLTLQPSDQVKAIGVFAAYRDYAGATWRASVEVPPHKTTKVTVTAGRTGLSVPPPPAPAPAGQSGS